MKPEEKHRLVKARPDLIRSLDVTSVLPSLRRPNMFTQQEVEAIMKDPRRRERVEKFLDALEKKTSETFHAFCDILENRFPHLFLLLSEWDQDDDDLDDRGLSIGASEARLDDEWAELHRSREYLIAQIDGGKIAPQLREKGIITEAQEQQILNDQDTERRTETFLDILEMKPVEIYKVFLEIVGEIYPHVYLELTSNGTDDDW